jgi:hypothetical protein
MELATRETSQPLLQLDMAKHQCDGIVTKPTSCLIALCLRIKKKSEGKKKIQEAMKKARRVKMVVEIIIKMAAAESFASQVLRRKIDALLMEALCFIIRKPNAGLMAGSHWELRLRKMSLLRRHQQSLHLWHFHIKPTQSSKELSPRLSPRTRFPR